LQDLKASKIDAELSEATLFHLCLQSAGNPGEGERSSSCKRR
jgi:hypothetical protein